MGIITVILALITAYGYIKVVYMLADRFENSILFHLKNITFEMYLIHYVIIIFIHHFIANPYIGYLIVYPITIIFSFGINKFSSSISK